VPPIFQLLPCCTICLHTVAFKQHRQSQNVRHEAPIGTGVVTGIARLQSLFPYTTSNSFGQVHVSLHYRHTLCMDAAQIGILKVGYQVILGCLLQQKVCLSAHWVSYVCNDFTALCYIHGGKLMHQPSNSTPEKGPPLVLRPPCSPEKSPGIDVGRGAFSTGDQWTFGIS
jgi:hypothetical protein